MNKNGETIFGPLYDKVGEGWHLLLDTFSDLIIWDMEFNSMPAVEITGVEERNQTLRIYFTGGNEMTDAYANYVRNLSIRLCEDCGSAHCDCTFWSMKRNESQ